MPSPALVIGLGGTGTLVATYIKKELMETSGGQWPLKEVKVLSFDTDTRQPEIGGQGQIRQNGQSTGAVRLGTGEFFPITGTVQQLMRDVVTGKYPYIGKWLLADWYLRNLPDKMFNLNEGAGQFRQFGRLSVFRDLASPGQSTIFNTLNDALVKLSRDNPTLKNLQVFIVGSLAGGTGAGMFADIAYLVRKLAEQSTVNLKTKMSVRGYLVLPDAFSQTIESNWLRSMHARAFAAMRENRRFTVSFDYERGYPIHYREGSDDPIWHNSLKGKLFDLLYYVDGNGERGRLNAFKMDRGVAPMLADGISAAIDRESGPVFASYVANVEAERLNRVTRGEFSEKTATFGSIGTYSIVFPIYQIIEGWTHRLGLEVLTALTLPDTKSIDVRSGIPKELLSNANQENIGEDGKTAAINFLRAVKPIAYQGRDEHGNTVKLEAEPTLLFGELARIAEMTVKPGSAVMQELMARNIEEWKPLFVPGGEDRETRRLIQRVETILNMRMYDKAGQIGTVLASDQMKPKEDPNLGVDRISGEVRNYKARLLGEEDSRTGQRTGGNYRSTLGQIAEYQLARFNLYLDVFTQVTLNGSPNRLGTEARGGKLGYLSEFFDFLFETLVRSQETLQRVQQNRREKGDTRRNAIAEAQETLQRMKTLADKKGMLGGPSNDAYQSQHAYLQAENQLIGILQTEALEDVLLDTLNRMIDYVASARESTQSWIQSLITSSDSLYAYLLRGSKQVESDRAAERDIRCRLAVSDSIYEEERYQNYVTAGESNWLNTLLSSLEWEMQTKMRGGRPKMELTLKVNLLDTNKAFSPDAGEDNNLSLWLNLCRQPFDKARQIESVIGYLANHREYKNPEKMAKEIFENLSVSLAHQGSNALTANFLRAFFQTENEGGHKEYLRRVIQEMAQLSSKRTVDTQPQENGAAPQEDKFVQFSNSEDRFKFTVVFTNELLELEKIDAYKQGEQAYLGSGDTNAKGDRRVLHIFPAEVHAAEYEARLPAALKQQMRLFADDLVLQLEDVNQFRQFLMCYVYGLIRSMPERDPQSDVTSFVFKLILPPEREVDEYGNFAKPEEIWLTKPSRDIQMLPALLTYNFIGKDIGHGDDYVRMINYDSVAKALNSERDKDAQRHLETMGFVYNTDLLSSINAIRDEKERLSTLRELARIERVSHRRNELETKTLPYWERLRKTPEGQKEYDLASVFLLILNDEVKAVRSVVETKIRTLREMGLLS